MMTQGMPEYEPLTAEDLVGRWEHINLKYQYAGQDVPASLTLAADGTMSGARSGLGYFLLAWK